MKYYLRILLILPCILCSSCQSTFFYSVLNSNNNFVEKTENGDFLAETDSLWIAYCFAGESAPFKITIFNKGVTPLLIDWHKSALRINDIRFNYAKDRLPYSEKVQGGVGLNTYPELYDENGQPQVSFSGTNYPSHISYVPPRTMISHTPIRLINVNYKNIKGRNYKNTVMADKNGNKVGIKRIDFSEERSPLKFNSYLTIYSGEKSFDNPVVYEQEFYISNLIKTKTSPEKLPLNLADRGDLFYIEKEPNYGFLNFVLGTTLVLGSVVLDVVIDSNYD